MTSTLIGSAAPTTGDLVTTTNAAGETLIGFIVSVLTGGSRIRPTACYLVRVGSGGGKRLAWDAADCTYITPEDAARSLSVGQLVSYFNRGEWYDATVVSVGHTRVAVTRSGRNGGNPFMVPAWQLMRVA